MQNRLFNKEVYRILVFIRRQLSVIYVNHYAQNTIIQCILTCT